MIPWLLLPLLLPAPERTYLASVETRSVHQLYGEYARGQGLEGPDARLSCKLLADPLTLCLKVEEEGKRRYVSQGDLQRWELTDVRARELAAGAVEDNPWQQVPIDGGGHYHQVKADPNRASAALLHPEWLSTLGPNPVVAVPARGVVVGWSAGDPELDKIMAVAVRRMYDELPEPLSPVALSWTDKGWRTWGQAKAR